MAGVIIWAADCVATTSGGIQWVKVFLAIIVFIHSPCDHYAKLSFVVCYAGLVIRDKSSGISKW